MVQDFWTINSRDVATRNFGGSYMVLLISLEFGMKPLWEPIKCRKAQQVGRKVTNSRSALLSYWMHNPLNFTLVIVTHRKPTLMQTLLYSYQYNMFWRYLAIEESDTEVKAHSHKSLQGAHDSAHDCIVSFQFLEVQCRGRWSCKRDLLWSRCSSCITPQRIDYH